MESSAAFGKVTFFGAALGKEQRASTSLKLSIRLLEKRLTSNIIRYIFSKRDQHSNGLCILSNRRLFAQNINKIDRM